MNYTCQFCGRPTTITEPNYWLSWERVDIDPALISLDKVLGVGVVAISCPNVECQQLSLKVRLTGAFREVGSWKEDRDDTLQSWKLLPDSTAKPMPTYIPTQLVADYTEACKILELSPKASATLSRRCLQGMIRDFWKIAKPTLKLEIDELENLVDADTWAAIDAIRSVGNIGAHFEKDVNVIVEIEPKEAALLISLIEDLFKDWYVERHDKQERRRHLINLAQEKEAERKGK